MDEQTSEEEKVVYSDTDSVFIDGSSVDTLDRKTRGCCTWDVKGTGDELLIIAAKRYALFDRGRVAYDGPRDDPRSKPVCSAHGIGAYTYYTEEGKPLRVYEAAELYYEHLYRGVPPPPLRALRRFSVRTDHTAYIVDKHLARTVDYGTWGWAFKDAEGESRYFVDEQLALRHTVQTMRRMSGANDKGSLYHEHDDEKYEPDGSHIRLNRVVELATLDELDLDDLGISSTDFDRRA